MSSENYIVKLYKEGRLEEARKLVDEADWFTISQSIDLSEDFIREFQDYVCWGYISVYQVLSEDFVREFKDKVYWDEISRNQKISVDFAIEFKDEVIWYILIRSVGENFINEMMEKLLEKRK